MSIREKFPWQVTCRDGNRWLRRGLILSSKNFCRENTLRFVEWWGWKGLLRSPAQPLFLRDGETKAQWSESHPDCSDCLFICPTLKFTAGTNETNKGEFGSWVKYGYPFTQQIFIFARHCSRHWGYSSNQSKQKSLPSWNLHSKEKRRTLKVHMHTGLPCGPLVRNLPTNAGDMEFDPWSKKISPAVGN